MDSIKTLKNVNDFYIDNDIFVVANINNETQKYRYEVELHNCFAYMEKSFFAKFVK